MRGDCLTVLEEDSLPCERTLETLCMSLALLACPSSFLLIPQDLAVNTLLAGQVFFV